MENNKRCLDHLICCDRKEIRHHCTCLFVHFVCRFPYAQLVLTRASSSIGPSIGPSISPSISPTIVRIECCGVILSLCFIPAFLTIQAYSVQFLSLCFTYQIRIFLCTFSSSIYFILPYLSNETFVFSCFFLSLSFIPNFWGNFSFFLFLFSYISSDKSCVFQCLSLFPYVPF